MNLSAVAAITVYGVDAYLCWRHLVSSSLAIPNIAVLNVPRALRYVIMMTTTKL